MGNREPYKKKSSCLVEAVQLNLDTKGFTYQKWGATQTCKPGDWIVNNGGDIYTVDKDVFAKTYDMVRPGVFSKTAPVWVLVADKAGYIKTHEGETHYQAGDYIVFEDETGPNGYAVSRDKFEVMYVPVGQSEKI